MQKVMFFSAILLLATANLHAAELSAGVARVDITERSKPVNDPCYAKALVLKSDHTVAVLITVDAVAIGEIGPIHNDFLGKVRAQVQKDLSIAPTSLIVNASHCHGIVRADSADFVVQAVKEAWKNLKPVKAGWGAGREDRISENRRLLMKDGSEIDMRRAYPMPRDEDIARVGPIDPQIGILRLDDLQGNAVAIVYNFACHPIMNAPSKGNSADYPGYASRVIEESFGAGAMAFFIQGCAGDINPARYKETNRPADAEPLGNLLGLAVVRAAKAIRTESDSPLKLVNQTISLPRAADYETRLAAISAEQQKLLASLKQTTLNFKSFLPLLIEQKLSPDHPSQYAQGYLHDKAIGNDSVTKFDSDNRTAVEAYLYNTGVMEQLIRLNANRALLTKHLEQTRAAGSPTLDVEMSGLRVGQFKLVTFPGELTVEIGLNIKKAAGNDHTFVAGYTNGYIYYLPTVAQRKNTGFAQEDCDCLVAPEWLQLFHDKAMEVLGKL